MEVLLNRLGCIIDDIRRDLCKLDIREEQTYKYLMFRLYDKIVLTMCEVFVLLKNEYPEGGLSLTRNIYEGIVIMNYIYKNSNDEELIYRFFDASEITRLKLWNEHLKLIKDGSKVEKQIEENEKEIEKYRTKYVSDGYNSKDILKNDYWWAGKGKNFSSMSKKTDFPKEVNYVYMNKILHLNAYSVLNYIYEPENKIHIGNNKLGLVVPFRYSLSYFFLGTMMIAEVISEIEFDKYSFELRCIYEKLNKLKCD